MRNREPETIADVIDDLRRDYRLSPDQKISTLIKASENDELDDDDEFDEDEFEEDDDDEFEDDYDD